MIDLSKLDVTTPMMKAGGKTALTVKGASITSTSDYVYQAPAGSYYFVAPRFGAHTESVHRTRSEWKEQEGWLFNSAEEHVNRQKFNLKEVIDGRKVVVAQAHNDEGNNPVCKVFWNDGDIVAGIRTKDVKTDPKNETVLEGFELGKPGTVTIIVTDSGLLTVEAEQDGRTGKVEKQLDSSWSNNHLVFHGGVYNQKDMDDTDKGDRSVFELLDLLIYHGAKTTTGVEVPASPVDTLNKLIDSAVKLSRSEMLTELNRITNLVDDSDLSDEEQKPLYQRIKDAKSKK